MKKSYPVLKNRPIDQWKVTELKEELKKRKLVTRGLKEELIRRLDESLRSEMDSSNQDEEENESGDDSQSKGDDDSQPKGDDDSQPKGDDDSQPKGDDDSQPKGDDESQPKGDDGETTLVNEAPEVDTGADIVVNNEEAQANSHAKGNSDETLPVTNESVTEAPEVDTGADIVVNNEEAQANSHAKGNSDETLPVTNESVTEAPEVDTGADIVVNNEEAQANSHAKGNSDETLPVTNESVTEAPEVERGDDIVVKGAEDQAVNGNESVTEAVDLHEGVDLVIKDEDNQGGGKILEADNVSGQAVDDDHGKVPVNSPPAVNDDVATDEKSVELIVAGTEVISSEAALPGNKNSESRTQMDAEDIKPSDEEVNQNMNDLNNQVSEVSPSLGVQNDSNSNDSVSINEMNELKDNIIADDVKLESDVKHELVQPSSSPIVPDGGKSCPMDVEEPENKVSVDETKISVKDEESSKKNSSADVGSPEKLNLDRSSCDDSMEEDTMENKQVDSTYISDGAGGSDEKTVVNMFKGETPDDIMGDVLSAATKDSHVEDTVAIAASTEKRKVPDDQEPITNNNEPSKRQRRWKTESAKASEPQSSSPVLSTTPRGVPQGPGLTRSFSRSNSNADDDTPKERVVPPPIKPPTDSLRIDNFVRPFTLKAVQEFLGKTGTVTSFWMDHIKTHCFVTYSSVEEATETRNTVYNLQWPPNGGRLLTVEFVDAEEVKSRLDGPPQPPTPVGPTNPPQAPAPVLPSPRQLGPRQKQMLQTNLPPPPPLTNPPPVRERLQPPPPPPPLETLEPPVVTLDDLFRKTKTTPRIYYLPLSEEEVKAKVEAQGRIAKA